MTDVLDSGGLDRLDLGLSMFEGVEVERWICIASTTLDGRACQGDDQTSNNCDAPVASFTS